MPPSPYSTKSSVGKDSKNTYNNKYKSGYKNEGNNSSYTAPSLRVPPQHLDSEKAFLGSIMLRPESIHDVMDIISLDSFYSERHRIIYSSMHDLFGKGQPIDLISLSGRLRENNQLEQSGGASYLTELVHIVPSSANIEYYAKVIDKKHRMRMLIDAAEHIEKMGYDESGELEELLDSAEKRIFEVTNYTGTHTYTQLKDVLGPALEQFDLLSQNKGSIGGVGSGFKDLDQKLSGFQKSDLIILAARPSMGKTSLALDIARNAAVMHNHPIAIFSLEMSAQQLVNRMLAAEAGVDSWVLKTGYGATEDDFTRLRDASDKLTKAPVFIDDTPANNIVKMRSVCRRLKAEHGLSMIIVDYLQLMAPVSSKYSDSMVNQVTEISRSLKHLAREMDVPVIALSQLSREVEKRGGEPRLSDLRDSGSIEQDADVVMFIHREDKYNKESDRPNIAKIMIEKHRNGATGAIELYFNEKKTSFQSIDKNDFGNGGGFAGNGAHNFAGGNNNGSGAHSGNGFGGF